MLQADTLITLGAGQYRLRSPLGGSAYGIVWRADGPHGPVALKLVNAEQMRRAEPAQQDRWTASACKEITFLRSLAPWDERHIVRLLDCGVHEGLPVMALELMERDLGACVQAARTGGQPIATVQILAWLSQVNQALAKVHHYGWRYLDLKPANVLQDGPTGRVKLADFGTNHLLADTWAPHYAGTASWQAPEQFFPAPGGGYDSDARSDYFALGAMFYYLVTQGTPLRFCLACGDAYRAHGTAGAQMLRERHAGAVPPTLDAAEAEGFAARIERCMGNGAGARALDLLRALLASERGERPSSALQISRMIGAIASACAPVRPVHVMAACA